VTTVAAAQTAFATSGQSGRPGVWLRTHEQLHAEVELLAQVIDGPVDRVVTYAPPEHLYGHLFGILLPEYLGVPVRHLWQTPLALPDLPDDERILLVCLPATWVLLRSLTGRLRAAPTVTAVHSSGPITRHTRQVLRSLEGSAFRMVEILGSTETGAVAHRRLVPRPACPTTWTLFDDVTLAGTATGEQALRVASPRLARAPHLAHPPGTHTMEDLVHPVGARQFKLVGRSTRMIKVNGRRVRLEDIEESLRSALPTTEVVCVPRVDDVRAEHYDLFFAGDPSPDTVRSALLAVLPGVPPPRLLRAVGHIPRGVTGKIRLDRLLAEARKEPTSYDA
jgi:acyl-coenzyme A synthetase/AMP-(fatty) acid ligase